MDVDSARFEILPRCLIKLNLVRAEVFNIFVGSALLKLLMAQLQSSPSNEVVWSMKLLKKKTVELVFSTEGPYFHTFHL